MNKLLISILTAIVAFNTPQRSVAASPPKSDEGAKNRSAKPLMPEVVAIYGFQTLNPAGIDGSVLESQSLTFAKPSIELIRVNLPATVNLVKELSWQANPTSPQNPPSRHSHHLRTILIAVTLGAVLLIVLASAAK